jgi:hypothetical protein
MFWTVISYIIIAAIIIIALTELSKLFGPFGYNSNYNISTGPFGFNSVFSFSSSGKQSEGFYLEDHTGPRSRKTHNASSKIKRMGRLQLSASDELLSLSADNHLFII